VCVFTWKSNNTNKAGCVFTLHCATAVDTFLKLELKLIDPVCWPAAATDNDTSCRYSLERERMFQRITEKWCY